MALLDMFRKRDDGAPKEEVTTPVVTDVLLQALIRSETITREKALTVPAVSGAVDFISNMIASMPVKLYKEDDGKVEERKDDERVKLLNGDTGDVLNGFQLKKAMVEDYLLGKGGYCYIRKHRNDVTGLFYVKDIHIDVIPNFKPIYKDYQILVLGEQHSKDDFIKLLRNTKEGGTGRGLTDEVGKVIEAAYNTLLFQLNMVKTGGNKRGFLQTDKKLGPDEIKALKIAWNKLYGNDNDNVVVLNNGLKFQEASQTANETQLNESKKTLKDEINDIFHIDPNDFYLTFKQAIYPIVKAFEAALNKDLLLEKEKNKFFFELDVKEIIKANVKERMEALKLAKEIGLKTINEMRREENLEYIKGMDVINVGLGAVLYDTNTHKYYTPNTDTVGDLNEENPTDQEIQKVIMDKEIDTAFEQSGNSSDL